jgi:hypothetical protein
MGAARMHNLESAIRAGAERAIRRHVADLRRRAAPLIVVTGDPNKPTVVVPSEARVMLDTARDFDVIADEIGGAS